MRVQMQLAYIDNGHLKNHHTGSKLTSKSKAYCLWRNLPRHCTFSKKKKKEPTFTLYYFDFTVFKKHIKRQIEL